MRATAAAVVWLALTACVESRTIRRTKISSGFGPVEYRLQRNRYELPNGLTVVLLPESKTNFVRVSVRYMVGAAEDPVGKSGLAHVVEHMMFELGPDRPLLSDRLVATALASNASTSWDATHYALTGMSEDLDELLAIEAERMAARCEQFGSNVFERELDVVRSEIRQQSGVAAAVDQIIRAEVYGRKHVYARSVVGTERGVAALELDDVCQFIESYYTPERAVLVVSGRFDANAVAERIEQEFSSVPARRTSPREHVKQVDLTGSDSEHRLPIQRATAFIVAPGSVFADSEGVYDGMLADLLEQAMFDAVKKHDYIASVSVGTLGGERAPLRVVGITVTDPNRLKDAVNVFFEKRGTLAGGITEIDVSLTRLTFATAMLRAMESIFSRDALIARYVQYGSGRLTLESSLAIRMGVGGTALRRRARQFFARTTTHVVYFYPDPGDKALEDRAEIQQTATRYDIGDWRAKVDRTELDRDLALPGERLDPKTSEFELDNGMRVVLAPDFAVPVAEVRMVFPGGYLHEPAELPGLAEATATLLRMNLDGHFWPRDRRFVYKAIKNSAPITTQVGEKTTTFRAVGLSTGVDETLWTLSFLLEQGHHKKSDLETYSSLLEREIDDEQRDRQRHEIALRQALFGKKHPYASVGLQSETGEKISILALRSYRETFYRPRGAALIVVGKFDAEAVEQEIRELFSEWKDYGAPPVAPAIPAAAGSNETRYFALPQEDSAQVVIAIAFATTPVKGKQRAALDVLREMLRLRMRSLREHLASTYGISVSHVHRTGPGQLVVRGAIDAERGAQAFEAMRGILDEFRNGAGLEEPFLRARRRRMQQLFADALESGTVAARLARAQQDGVEDYYGRAAEVARLRLADVRKVIDAELAGGVVVLIGPKTATDASFSAAGITDFETLE